MLQIKLNSTNFRNCKKLKLHYFNFISIFIIIIKTSSTGPSGKNKVVYKLLSQPHKHLRHGKLNKTQLGDAPNGRLHPWTHLGFRCETQCIGKVIPHSNMSRQERPSKLDVLHLDTSNFNRWAAAATRVCRNLVADESSRSEQTVIIVRINPVQHTVTY